MWNYRVVRKKNTYIDPANKKERVDYTYAIHEAYYDENGHVGAITQEPVEPFGEDVEELRHQLVTIMLSKESIVTAQAESTEESVSIHTTSPSLLYFIVAVP